jgi:hypothetical protein
VSFYRVTGRLPPGVDPASSEKRQGRPMGRPFPFQAAAISNGKSGKTRFNPTKVAHSGFAVFEDSSF